jgi:pyridoxal phosphate enzyme (YggS family)
MESQIANNLEQVRTRIAESAQRVNRAPEDVLLLAVTKTHPAGTIREAMEAGQIDFAESKLQEARLKIPELPSRLRWHFIGHLQSNKARQVLSLFQVIHSVDSAELLSHLSRISGEEGVYPRVCLQVNVAAEASKFGFEPAQLLRDLDRVLTVDRVQIEGLMTVPPLGPEAESSRRYFVRLRELRDEIERRSGARLPHLSMGMSNDYAVAVEEGATMVRVGTAIFGERRSTSRAATG